MIRVTVKYRVKASYREKTTRGNTQVDTLPLSNTTTRAQLLSGKRRAMATEREREKGRKKRKNEGVREKESE